jgi:hypothetical protein
LARSTTSGLDGVLTGRGDAFLVCVYHRWAEAVQRRILELDEDPVEVGLFEIL